MPRSQTGPLDAPHAARTRALELAFFAAALAWFLRPVWDIDLFLHVAIGRLVMREGMPSTDVLSAATPDAPWTPFQAGYEVLVALLHDAVGLYGVNALHSIAMALAFVVLRRRFASLTHGAGATLLLLALSFVCFEARVRPRPHVVNLLLEALVLLPVAAGRVRALTDRRALLGLFGIAALWSALHAMGALWLLAVLGAHAVASETADQRKQAALAALVALVGIAIVPGSAGGIVHVLRVQDQWKEFVPELAPAWALIGLGPSGIIAFVTTLSALAAVLVVLAQRPERARYPVVLSALGLAFGALWIARLAYYAPLALALVWPELRAFGERMRVPERAALWSSLAIALVLLLEVAPRYTRAGINPWTTALHPGAFPVAELNQLARAGIRGRAFNETMWGGYALYVLYPNIRVISDGRITFGPEVAEILRRMRDTPPEVVADVAHQRFGIDLLIWSRGRMRENERWKLIVRGERAEVFARNDASLPARKSALMAARRAAH